MLIELILVIIALIWLSFATYFDIKTREIPNWLTYSLILIAVILRLLYSTITKEWTFFLYGLLGFLIFFIVGNIMYHTKQWGGGDSKLIMGLGILFATYPKFLLNYFNPNLTMPFLLSLFINILIVGAIYGLIWTFVLAIKNQKAFLINLKKMLHTKKIKLLEMAMFTLTILLILFVFTMVQDLKLKLILMLLMVIPLFLTYVIILTKAIEKISFIKKIPISKLTEGDWINHDILHKGKKIYSKKSPCVTNAQIELLKKLKIKTVTVKEGIPFVPSFLIGTIISLIFGSLFYF